MHLGFAHRSGWAAIDRPHHLAAEDIQRQVTIVVVIAVKLGPFRILMPRHVRGIDVKDECARRSGSGRDERIDERPVRPPGRCLWHGFPAGRVRGWLAKSAPCRRPSVVQDRAAGHDRSSPRIHSIRHKAVGRSDRRMSNPFRIAGSRREVSEILCARS